MDFDEHRLSFGAAAEHYDRARPGYPITALNWVFEPIGGRGRVVDLGAGTGLLTRVALATGCEVIPVEPDPGMRAQLETATPGVSALAGSAEEIPLPDGSVDAVIVGTAYHWFDVERAHPEIARVLRTGGVFAPMWNDRDTTLPWTRAFHAIIQRAKTVSESRKRLHEDLSFGPLFSEAEVRQFEHSVRQTPQGLKDLIASRSYYLVAPEQERARLRTAVEELCRTHPDLAGQNAFDLPYATTVYRAQKI